MEKPDNIAFIIDGGAGRVVASIPALLKFAKNNPGNDFIIIVAAWESLLWGIPEFNNRVFSTEHKGVFNQFIKNRVIVKPEPYALWEYYNQKISIVEAFDVIINHTCDHSDLSIRELKLTKQEKIFGYETVMQARNKFNKERTVVIQPYGQGTTKSENGSIFDISSRSLEIFVYLKIVEELSKKYNVIQFTQPELHYDGDTYTLKPKADLRHWAGVIGAADYFIGCDSVGQHIARAFKKPGTVIIGSTFPENTTYTDWFNVYTKKDFNKTYSPIRIVGADCYFSDIENNGVMEFTEEEIKELLRTVDRDILDKI